MCINYPWYLLDSDIIREGTKDGWEIAHLSSHQTSLTTYHKQLRACSSSWSLVSRPRRRNLPLWHNVSEESTPMTQRLDVLVVGSFNTPCTRSVLSIGLNRVSPCILIGCVGSVFFGLTWFFRIMSSFGLKNHSLYPIYKLLRVKNCGPYLSIA